MDLENRSPDDRFSRATNPLLYRNETSAETIAIPSSPWLQPLKRLFGWHEVKNSRKTEPNEVFISYSRKDQAFSQVLVSDLKESGFTSWVDLKNIPPSARWREEVEAGIDGAHAFIFIISLASVASGECKKEVDYAIAQKKRVIPVLREDLETIELVHQKIRDLNWINFRHSDPYEIAKEKLISALITDLDYNQTHARLLVKAREWVGKKKDASYLLHGKDIKDAELWLKDGEQKQSDPTSLHPDPTSLHKQYIKASRRSASFRRKTQISIFSIMATAAVLVGLKKQENSILYLTSSVRYYFAKMAVNAITKVYNTVVGAQEYVYPYIYPQKIQSHYVSKNAVLPITKISCKLDYEHNPGSLPPINSSWHNYTCTSTSRTNSEKVQYIGSGSFDQDKLNKDPSFSRPVFVGKEKLNFGKVTVDQDKSYHKNDIVINLVIYPKGAFCIGDFTKSKSTAKTITLEGEGECKYLSGDIYQGPISNDQRNDRTKKKATAYFADNQSLWEGEFINDKPGSGKYLIPPIQ